MLHIEVCNLHLRAFPVVVGESPFLHGRIGKSPAFQVLHGVKVLSALFGGFTLQTLGFLAVTFCRVAVTDVYKRQLPRCQNPHICGFAPAVNLVGECLPQTLLCGLRRKKSSETVWQFCFFCGVGSKRGSLPFSDHHAGIPRTERSDTHSQEIQHAPPPPCSQDPHDRGRIRRLHRASIPL